MILRHIESALYIRTDFRFVPCQWETAFLCNDDSFWLGATLESALYMHDDVIKWNYFPRYWPFVRGIQRSLVNFSHNGEWREGLMFSLICASTNGWENNRGAGDLRRLRAYYDATVSRELIVIFKITPWNARTNMLQFKHLRDCVELPKSRLLRRDNTIIWKCSGHCCPFVKEGHRWDMGLLWFSLFVWTSKQSSSQWLDSIMK